MGGGWGWNDWPHMEGEWQEPRGTSYCSLHFCICLKIFITKKSNKYNKRWTLIEAEKELPYPVNMHIHTQSKSEINVHFAVLKSHALGTFLVAQRLRIRLPMQGTRVWALVREDPTCRGATKPVRHSYWACALESVSHNYWACTPRACASRSHRNEKPTHHNKE